MKLTLVRVPLLGDGEKFGLSNGAQCGAILLYNTISLSMLNAGGTKRLQERAHAALTLIDTSMYQDAHPGEETARGGLRRREGSANE